MNAPHREQEPRLAVAQRLLLVADRPDVIGCVRPLAAGLDYAVTVATSLDQVHRYLDGGLPTLVVLDLCLSDSLGTQVIRHLQLRRTNVLLVLISSLDRPVLKSAQALVAHPGLRLHGVLQKPLDPAQLERELVSARRELLLDADDLERAIDAGELVVHYQPKIDLHSGHGWPIHSFEALARWQHPELGLVMPDQFIPLAEHCGLIRRLTLNIFGVALTEFAPILGRVPEMALAVNVSALLLRDESLAAELAGIAAEAGIRPSQVVLEITESGAFDDQVGVMEVMGRLRRAGFRLSMDDFGSGYSSLAQLYRMPFSELKLDRSLIRDLKDNDETRVIAELLIDLSRRLNITVCAEGTESRSNLEILRSMGCDAAQGFYFTEPRCLADFTPLLRYGNGAGPPLELVMSEGNSGTGSRRTAARTGSGNGRTQT